MSSIPEALKPTTMSSVSTMDIETNVLDPIVVNQSFARFVLERKGILDMGSVVQLAVTCSATASGKAYLPIKTGIHALIKRAVLRIGSRVVAISDEYGTYQTVRRAFKTAEEKSQKDMVKAGCVDVVCPDIAQTGLLQLRDVVYDAAGTAGSVMPQYALKAADAETPVFTIKLSELFPAMREVSLPLYLINEPCSIELSFQSQAASNAQEGRIAVFQDGIAENQKAISVSTVNVKFLADYLTYDDDRMSETARMVMSESGMTIPYEDIVMTSTNFPAVTQPGAGTPLSTKVVRDLGLSGMSVRAIVAHMRKPVVNKLLGQYASDAYEVSDAYNIRVNDKQIYPRDISSETVKSHQLGQVYGTDISVSSGEYSKDIATDKSVADHTVTNQPFTASTFEGHAQTALLGSQHFLGIDLSISPLNVMGSGMEIGQKPVQFLHTVTNTNTDYQGREVKYFASVERMMTLKGGVVHVSA
jgi:hypothetical protein